MTKNLVCDVNVGTIFSLNDYRKIKFKFNMSFKKKHSKSK